MKHYLVLGGFGAAIAIAIVFAILALTELGPSDLSVGGYLALAFGVVATLGLGIGLMALVFYSSREGYDDIDRGKPPR